MSRTSKAESRYSKQLDSDFRLLRFESSIEAEFRDALAIKTHSRTMVGLFIGLLLTFTFVAIDYFGAGFLRASMAVSLIAFLIVPGLMACLVLGLHRSLRRHLSTAAGVLIAAIGVGIVLATIESRRSGGHFPYEVLMTLSLYTYFLIGLTFYPALTCGLLAVATYAAAGFAGAYAKPEFYYDFYFVVSVYLLGGWGCYIIEYAERRDFLQRRILNEMAQIDSLTGVPNRRSLEQHLAKVWREASRERHCVAVIMTDIDHFKGYNDRYGHPAGDDCLQAVAQAMASRFRRPLDMLARYGGEEFSGVWYNIRESEVEARAEDLRKAVESLAIVHEGSSVSKYVTVSIGVLVLYPDPRAGGPDTAVKQADQVLYRSKKNGRNQAGIMVRGILPAADTPQQRAGDMAPGGGQTAS